MTIDAVTLRLESFIGPMFDLALNLLTRNSNLRAQRDLLLPKLISGEIDVSEYPEQPAEAAE